MNELISPPAIYGEAVAGESIKVRSTLESLINNVNKNTFDIGELLAKVKKKSYYTAWGFSTFPEYVKTLNIKERKAQYLARIVETFETVGVTRDKYEPLGIARCREIASLDPAGTWKNPESGAETPMSEFIIGFVAEGENLDMDTLKKHVRTLKGFVGENDLTWRNICMTRAAAENIWDKAIELAKMNIGSVSKDESGMSKDASDGAAAEVLAVSYLNDPANNQALVGVSETVSNE